MPFPFFFSLVLFAIWFAFARKRSEHASEKNHVNFWDLESSANNTRKKSLEYLDYITIPLNSLPFFDSASENIQKYQTFIQESAHKKIVNLTGITNTELKSAYGVANLPLLMEYDQNFTEMSRTLYLWGKELNEAGFVKEAIQVLEFGVACKTDVSGHYYLLANIYKQENRTDDIAKLIKTAEQLNTLMKDSILKTLKTLM